jgi:hypothetical protein
VPNRDLTQLTARPHKLGDEHRPESCRLGRGESRGHRRRRTDRSRQPDLAFDRSPGWVGRSRSGSDTPQVPFGGRPDTDVGIGPTNPILREISDHAVSASLIL